MRLPHSLDTRVEVRDIRKVPQKRHSAVLREAAIELAFAILDANSGLNSAVLRKLLEPHAKDPEPLLKVLGLSMPPSKDFGFVCCDHD